MTKPMPTSNTRCEATTKTRGTQCTNWNAAWCASNKKLLCHLHHPDATYRQQVAAKCLTRTQRRNHRMANKSPNRGPLQSLSVVNHGPIGLAGNVKADDPNERPADGKRFHGIDAPMRYLTPSVGKGELEKKAWRD